MDPITVSIVVGLALSAYDLLGGVWGSIQTSRLQKQAQKIADALNRNAELKSKIYQAYQEKDYKLANALIMSSPVGSAYKVLREEIKRNADEYKEKTAKIEESDEKLKVAQENIKAPTSDLLGAIWNTAHNNTDEINKAVQSSNDLVEGGMKNV